MNVETGEAIGDRVGQTIEVESDADGSAVGCYLRINVRLDIRKPLRRGVTMEGEHQREKIWCRFKYEFLPNFLQLWIAWTCRQAVRRRGLEVKRKTIWVLAESHTNSLQSSK